MTDKIQIAFPDELEVGTEQGVQFPDETLYEGIDTGGESDVVFPEDISGPPEKPQVPFFPTLSDILTGQVIGDMKSEPLPIPFDPALSSLAGYANGVMSRAPDPNKAASEILRGIENMMAYDVNAHVGFNYWEAIEAEEQRNPYMLQSKAKAQKLIEMTAEAGVFGNVYAPSYHDVLPPDRVISLAEKFHRLGWINDEELKRTRETPPDIEIGTTPTPNDFFSKTVYEELRDIGKGGVKGAVGTVESFMNGLEWLGGNSTAGRTAAELSDVFEDWRIAVTPERETFLTDVAGGFGSMFTFLIPSLAVTKPLQALGKITPRIATWANVSVMATGESLAEAGSSYQEALDRTGLMSEAQDAAKFTFWSNMPMLIVTNRLGLFAEKGTAVGRVFKSGAGEGIQEGYQETVGALAQGEAPEARNVLYAGLIGAIVGSTVSMVEPAVDKVLKIPEMSPDLRGTYETAAKEAFEKGANLEEADIAGTKAIAETKEGAKYIKAVAEAADAVLDAEAAMARGQEPTFKEELKAELDILKELTIAKEDIAAKLETTPSEINTMIDNIVKNEGPSTDQERELLQELSKRRLDEDVSLFDEELGETAVTEETIDDIISGKARIEDILPQTAVTAEVSAEQQIESIRAATERAQAVRGERELSTISRAIPNNKGITEVSATKLQELVPSKQISGRVYEVKLPNGSTIAVATEVDFSTLTQEEIDAIASTHVAEGRISMEDLLAGNFVIGGENLLLGKDGVVLLAKDTAAEVGRVLDEELFELARKMTLTGKEIKALDEQFGGLEGSSNAYKDWNGQEDSKTNGLFEKIKDFFKTIDRLLGRLTRDIRSEDIFRAVRKGEVFSRGVSIRREDVKLGTGQDIGGVPHVEVMYKNLGAGMIPFEPGVQTQEQAIDAALRFIEENGLPGSFNLKPVDSQENLRRWGANSQVRDANGELLVVYSGHANIALYGDRFNPRTTTAGGFYASLDPAAASGYSLGMGILGAKEHYEDGSQYRFKRKKLWQVKLTQEQKDKLDELKQLKDRLGNFVHPVAEYDRWVESNKAQEPIARQALVRGPYDLFSIFKMYETQGNDVRYAKRGNKPFYQRQGVSKFEELLNALGIEWNALDWAQPGVFQLYLNITNPLDTAQLFPQDLLKALEKKAKREPARTNTEISKAMWTKEYPLNAWVEDIKQDDGNHGWTAQIPKKALPILKEFGYDGIKDTGGKMGSMDDNIWIAFDAEQIKSATGNVGTYSPEDPRMSFNLKKRADLKAELADMRNQEINVIPRLVELGRRHYRQGLTDTQWTEAMREELGGLAEEFEAYLPAVLQSVRDADLLPTVKRRPASRAMASSLRIDTALRELTDISGQLKKPSKFDAKGYRATKGTALKVVDRTINDNPGQPRMLYRAASKKAKERGPEGVLPYNREYKTEDPQTGGLMQGIYWSTSLTGAQHYAREKYGSKADERAEIQAVSIQDIPAEVIVLNATKAGSLSSAWFAFPGDMNLEFIQIKPLTEVQKSGKFEVRRTEDAESQRQRGIRAAGQELERGAGERGLPEADEPARPSAR
ncbi:MAG: hypothetical protein KAR06_07945, partial [Deltaproteobacteria bacterium]|nr:hypothetical protein [Deltaproteobacteria bacterium]